MSGSEITRVIFPSIQTSIESAMQSGSKISHFPAAHWCHFLLVFFCSIKKPANPHKNYLCQGVIYVGTIILNAVRNCSHGDIFIAQI